jgi:hypothetical protein
MLSKNGNASPLGSRLTKNPYCGSLQYAIKTLTIREDWLFRGKPHLMVSIELRTRDRLLFC